MTCLAIFTVCRGEPAEPYRYFIGGLPFGTDAPRFLCARCREYAAYELHMDLRPDPRWTTRAAEGRLPSKDWAAA